MLRSNSAAGVLRRRLRVALVVLATVDFFFAAAVFLALTFGAASGVALAEVLFLVVLAFALALTFRVDLALVVALRLALAFGVAFRLDLALAEVLFLVVLAFALVLTFRLDLALVVVLRLALAFTEALLLRVLVLELALALGAALLPEARFLLLAVLFAIFVSPILIPLPFYFFFNNFHFAENPREALQTTVFIDTLMTGHNLFFGFSALLAKKIAFRESVNHPGKSKSRQPAGPPRSAMLKRTFP